MLEREDICNQNLFVSEEHFGSAVPAFHPEFYLTMTKPTDEDRQSQLEQLQNVTLDSNITNSDALIVFLKLRQDTFKIQTRRAFLDVYLADGSNIRLYIQTSDTAERILLFAVGQVGLLREFIKYFSLFLFQDCDDESLSVVEKVAELELPYVRLQNMKELHCKLGIRKCCMDPSLNTRLMDCRISLNLLHTQAVQEVKRNWVKPTDEQMQELQFPKNVNKAKISYCMTLPTNKLEVSFKINRLRIWQVTFLVKYTKDAKEDTLELQSEYNDSGTNWIILYTKQFFSQSFQERIRLCEENGIRTDDEGIQRPRNGEQIKMPEQMKNSKKYSIQQKGVIHLGCISRKRFLVRPNEDDCVFEKIREEDLNNLF
ncbi:LOW QUALITY PROTEIN: sorting nexin-31 [Geothlypis trichas]